MPLHRSALALLLLLPAVLVNAGVGNTFAQAPQASASVPACIAPADLRALHLYGLWRAEFDDGERSSVLFERHPEHADSLRGAVNRGGRQSLLSGDVDEGELVLDESDDGQRISAVWVARALPEACGRAFRGERRAAQGSGTAAVGAGPRGLVLRRVPGWN